MNLEFEEVFGKTGYSRKFVDRWSDTEDFEDRKREGRPRSVLDEPTLRKLENKKLKPGVSKRKLSKEITDKGLKRI